MDSSGNVLCSVWRLLSLLLKVVSFSIKISHYILCVPADLLGRSSRQRDTCEKRSISCISESYAEVVMCDLRPSSQLKSACNSALMKVTVEYLFLICLYLIVVGWISLRIYSDPCFFYSHSLIWRTQTINLKVNLKDLYHNLAVIGNTVSVFLLCLSVFTIHKSDTCLIILLPTSYQ